MKCGVLEKIYSYPNLFNYIQVYFRMLTVNFTPIYIFADDHLTLKVMSACENETSMLGKMFFLVCCTCAMGTILISRP